jgi:hypothetical protein
MVMIHVSLFHFSKYNFSLNVTHSVSLIATRLYCWFAILIFFSSRDEFRKLKSEVDGPQFSEYDLAKYRKKLDEERESKLKGLGSSLNKKKRKKHNHYRRHSSSRDRDRDHKRRRSKSEGSPTRSPVGRRRNFSEDEYYRSEDDENYEKRNQHRKDENERVEKVVIKVFRSRKKICRPVSLFSTILHNFNEA